MQQYLARQNEIASTNVSNKARMVLHDIRAILAKMGRNESLSVDSHGGGRYDPA